MSKFKNKILNKVKKHLNYTHSNVSISSIECNSMYFLFFNDLHESLEFHSDKHYEFATNKVLNKKTMSFSIPYRKLDGQRIQIEYDSEGQVKHFKIGFVNPVYRIWKGNKQTSHSHKGDGLFTVKSGFREYIEDINKQIEDFEFLDF